MTHPQKTTILRSVRVYYFVAPSQRLVTFDYSNLKRAVTDWGTTLLYRAAGELLQPWISERDYTQAWRGPDDGQWYGGYTVRPRRLVVRYQSGALIPKSDIQEPYRKRRTRKKRKPEQPAMNQVGRRLREQARACNDEPQCRPSQRVHPLYYEDAWERRKTERNWKSQRNTQWVLP